MGWIRVDDAFSEHPKLAQIGPIGWGFWLAALAYCNRNLTNGFVPRPVALRLFCGELVDGEGAVWTLGRTSGLRGEDIDADWLIELLLGAGVFEPAPGGYMVHDYLDFQPSKEEVLARQVAQHTNKVLGGKRRSAGASRDSRGRLLSAAQDQQNQQTIQQTSSTEASSGPAVDPAALQPQPQPQELLRNSMAPTASSQSPLRTRQRDELWDAVMAVCGVDTASVTASSRGAYNRAVGDLRRVAATPAEVSRRGRRWSQVFPGAALTPPALARHWAELNGSNGHSSSVSGGMVSLATQGTPEEFGGDRAS